MTNRITYPLTVALYLSPVRGALYAGEEGQVHIHTLEGWLVTGELGQEAIMRGLRVVFLLSCYSQDIGKYWVDSRIPRVCPR